MEVGDVTVRIVAKDENFSAFMTRARREAQQFGKTMDAIGHNAPSSMQAASGAIRLLEGDITRNVRAVERFITTIPGVGKALVNIFPLVGAAAFAGVIARVGSEAYAAIQKVQQASKSIDSAFASLNLSGRTANDTLRITNDRLENEIAKLEGKPQNNLALSIDEARLAADKMAESLDRDNQKVKQLLSQNAVPWWAGFLGKAGTDELTSKTLNPQNQKLADLGNQAAIARGQGNNAEADRLTAQIDAQRNANISDNAKLIEQYKASQNLPGGLDQGANLSALYGQQAMYYGQQDNEQQTARNLADEKKKQQLTDAKDQLEAAKRAAAAIKQAQEQIVAQWRQGLEEDKANGEVSLAQEAEYWMYRASTARKGSLSYIDALNEANKAIGRINADTMRQQKEGLKASQEWDALSGGTAEDHPDDTRAQGDVRSKAHQQMMDSLKQSYTPDASDHESVEYLKNLNEGIALQRENANAIAEASLQMAEMNGQVSRLDAAQARAALHAQQYAEATAALADAIAKAQELPEGFERSQRIAGLQAQGTQMAGQRQMQIMQDQQAVTGQQTFPAIKQALDQMVQEWGDMASSLKSVIPQTLSSLNNDLVKLVTGQYKKGDFGHTLIGAGQSMVGAGLRGAESKLLGMAGLGKRDGSSELSALWVMVAGASAGLSTSSPTLSAGVGGLASMIPGMQGVQPFLGSLVSALPHLAGGGDILGGHTALVGEHGPELFTPGGSGHITPHNALMTSSGGDTHIHVDARGATDPAAIHAAVMRAAPHIVSAASQTMHQHSLRTPRGR